MPLRTDLVAILYDFDISAISLDLLCVYFKELQEITLPSSISFTPGINMCQSCDMACPKIEKEHNSSGNAYHSLSVLKDEFEHGRIESRALSCKWVPRSEAVALP